MTPESSQLIARIDSAWANASYPGDDSIAVAGSYDFGMSDYFRGKDWKGHPIEKLRLYCFALTSGFTPKAYVYWLAAYLRAAVEHPHELSQGLNALVDSVTPEAALGYAPPDQAVRFGSLTSEQIAVASDIIEYLARTFADDVSFTQQAKTAVDHLHSLFNARAA